MERMVPEPRTFRELVEADVRRAARLVLEVQDEIDPQFRIATPEGDYWIAVTLPREGMLMLRRVSSFMRGKRLWDLSSRVNCACRTVCTRSA